MNRRLVGRRAAGCVTFVAAATVLLSAGAGGPQASLAAQLASIREAGRLPAVAAVRFTSDRVIDEAAVGLRRIDADAAVTLDDRWHIGSITKSFTSLLAAQLVERGEARWDLTIAEMFGVERAGTFAAATLEQLLGHRSGLPANLPPLAALALSRPSDPVERQRQTAVTQVLASTPIAPPGERFLYSNAGYVLVGAWLESRLGQPWEAIVRSRILDPLSLTSAGFGPPLGAEPRGHRGPTPVEPGPGADNLPYLGPAGTLHMSVRDLARWGRMHLAGERGRDGLVRAGTFRQLHSGQAGGTYALGWALREAGGRRVIWHNGSNTLWYAVVAFDPEADRGLAIVTNAGLTARDAIDAAVDPLLRSAGTS
jgi:CubicO group peptidase (beta-lactamase class C family)